MLVEARSKKLPLSFALLIEPSELMPSSTLGLPGSDTIVDSDGCSVLLGGFEGDGERRASDVLSCSGMLEREQGWVMLGIDDGSGGMLVIAT